MGDPRKIKKKYSKPAHMWQKVRIDEERALVQEFGLSNKREIWRATSQLRTYTKQAKKLIPEKSAQADKEKTQLLDKLMGLGLIKNKTLESVLDITLKDILERRLQTIIIRKNLAKTIKQSRQMITHAHISVENKKITSPSYLVRVDEEAKISFSPKSSFASPEHPERNAPVAAKTPE